MFANTFQTTGPLSAPARACGLLARQFSASSADHAKLPARACLRMYCLASADISYDQLFESEDSSESERH